MSRIRITTQRRYCVDERRTVNVAEEGEVVSKRQVRGWEMSDRIGSA
jgi:hypothetical protein